MYAGRAECLQPRHRGAATARDGHGPGGRRRGGRRRRGHRVRTGHARKPGPNRQRSRAARRGIRGRQSDATWCTRRLCDLRQLLLRHSDLDLRATRAARRPPVTARPRWAASICAPTLRGRTWSTSVRQQQQLARVQPGTAADSFLYQKLLAATEPGSVQISRQPDARRHSAAVRQRARGGPAVDHEGRAQDGQRRGRDQGHRRRAVCSTHACPTATPVKTKPLEPPAPEEGIQLRTADRISSRRSSEIEQCTPFAYDFTDQVPAQVQGRDAQRHVHQRLARSSGPAEPPHGGVESEPRTSLSVAANDPDWKCVGGANDGKHCERRKRAAPTAARKASARASPMPRHRSATWISVRSCRAGRLPSTR